MDWRNVFEHIYIAIRDCEIASEVCQGEETIQRGQYLRPLTCDIASKGIQSDRRKVLYIERSLLKSEEAFIKSEDDFFDRRRINKVGRGFLCIGGRF